ncbi:uncharacterized protein PHACADRAFT_247583 [Phanerochaete carnosa HHB-10118-sp]|uniref:Uncharacterized protein n=1 Tax=Phanerochaete carnosa (strain HHB-10118-sp) TaxID=650164 RepID=K5WB20_PHACS|nr:uncharacterized protein PHACADRAFT_247583 [Phanerochaete carnosa HHB-10118-sp]EKM61158.1 hypothetical protein PHACADRAFT_247583 [Phanerochaete carnosa HHB-10118-sp]
MAAPDLKQLLGNRPSSEVIVAYISHLGFLVPDASASPEVKSYPDAIYFNYFPLGLSLLFKPVNGYKPKTGMKREDLKDVDLVLDGIDIYNVPPPKPGATSRHKSAYSLYPVEDFTIRLVAIPDNARPATMEVKRTTTGKDFVSVLGEPDRKGGGAGPSSGSIGIWCEWSKDGVMVEFGGDESRGPQAWEKGKDAVWKVISIFSSPSGDA